MTTYDEGFRAGVEAAAKVADEMAETYKDREEYKRWSATINVASAIRLRLPSPAPDLDGGLHAPLSPSPAPDVTASAREARLREALRKVSIQSVGQLQSGGGVVHTGWTCALCKEDWDKGQPENHKADCLASLSYTGEQE